MSTTGGTQGHPRGKALAGLALGALGVVYGDIGTSPLYAIRECFSGPHAVAVTPEHVLGVMSLVFWAITFVVTFKYLTFVMRADNHGEGGIVALMALVADNEGRPRRAAILAGLGLFGAALLYGDGIITPAVSVLGAVEGLETAAPGLTPYVTGIASLILAMLFWVQKRGTGRIGRVFGPIMVVWFVCISLLGIRGILMHPSVLLAVNPLYAVRFFLLDGTRAFLILGAVVLVITGGEALYADMGHFGRRPIRLAWLFFAMPALLINYFGQSALLLRDPGAAANPFYALVPEIVLYPMIVVATAAAIVASQALISGCFSLTRQAVQIGYCPRVRIVHTSSMQEGQIYIPEVNKILAIGTIALVIAFGDSSNLAAAYGIAVTGTMIITSVLFHEVLVRKWNWPAWRANMLTGVFLVVDLAFFGANIIKVGQGGWVPILAAIAIFLVMTTWREGRMIVQQVLSESSLPLDLFLKDLHRKDVPRVRGTAVFMTSDAGGAPPVLLHHLKHNKVLHDRVVIMSFQTQGVPVVPEAARLHVQDWGLGFHSVVADYGFMETPELSRLVLQLTARGLELKTHDTSYYLGRETLFATGKSRLARWRKQLFIIMARNAQSATAYFGLPPNRVVELGAQIQL